MMPPRNASCCVVAIALIASGCEISFDPTGAEHQTYSQYTANGGGDWFDVTGASDISHSTAMTQDGYDAWWRFSVSETDFDRIVTNVVAKESGPEAVVFHKDASKPPKWKPDADPPDWWSAFEADPAKAMHWCHQAGDAERHHGWIFIYDVDGGIAWCWHWNHQWSSAQCS